MLKDLECRACDYTKEDHWFDRGVTKAYCPVCGHELHEVFTRPTFVLSGSGWAKDGYRK